MDEYQQTIVAQWNEIALESVRDGGGGPTKVSWSMTAFHSAVFDAWAAYDADALGVNSRLDTLVEAVGEEAKAEAISYAAFTALSTIYPDDDRVEAYRAFMLDNGYDPDADPADPGDPASIGIAAANAMLAQRATDGSNFRNDFADITGFKPVNSADPATGRVPGGEDFDPNAWQPLRVPTGTATDESGLPVVTDDPASFKDQIAITPHYGNVKSFSLVENDMVRPPAPPLLGDFSEYVDGNGQVTTGDAAYREQFGILRAISAGLTDEQKLTAEFWADGPRTEQPPGHWNQLAQDIAKRDQHTLDDDVKMFFALNNAIYDAGIATWEAKYTYDYIRPQSAIRDLFGDETFESYAGPNLGTQIISGADWIPYQSSTFVTPPFPEWVSGHSTFSGVAAATLREFTGSDAFFDGVSTSNYDLNGDGELDLLGEFLGLGLVFENSVSDDPIQLRWNTLTEASDSAGESRRFGGIHIEDGDLFGREVAADLAPLVWAQSQAYIDGTADALLRAPAATDEADLIQGGFDDDFLFGAGGNDVFRPGTGDDRIDGGDGFDTVDYAERDAAVSFRLTNDRGVMVMRGEETDRLDDIEAVRVGGTVYRTDLDAGEHAGIVARVYQQVLGREGDAAGRSYWVEALDDGGSAADLAAAFIGSAEYADGAGGAETNAAFVAGQYVNLRGSAGDDAGLDFWVDALDGGAVTRGEAAVIFAESDESVDRFFATRVDDGVFEMV